MLLSPTFGEKNPRPQSLRKQFKREWKAAGLPMETAREILAARRAFKRGENDDLVGLALGEDQAVAVPACVFLADALGSQKALEFARSRKLSKHANRPLFLVSLAQIQTREVTAYLINTLRRAKESEQAKSVIRMMLRLSFDEELTTDKEWQDWWEEHGDDEPLPFSRQLELMSLREGKAWAEVDFQKAFKKHLKALPDDLGLGEIFEGVFDSRKNANDAASNYELQPTTDRGIGQLSIGKFDRAATELEAALKASDDDFLAAYMLGIARFERREFARAADAFALVEKIGKSSSSAQLLKQTSLLLDANPDLPLTDAVWQAFDHSPDSKIEDTEVVFGREPVLNLVAGLVNLDHLDPKRLWRHRARGIQKAAEERDSQRLLGMVLLDNSAHRSANIDLHATKFPDSPLWLGARIAGTIPSHRRPDEVREKLSIIETAIEVEPENAYFHLKRFTFQKAEQFIAENQDDRPPKELSAKDQATLRAILEMPVFNDYSDERRRALESVLIDCPYREQLIYDGTELWDLWVTDIAARLFATIRQELESGKIEKAEHLSKLVTILLGKRSKIVPAHPLLKGTYFGVPSQHWKLQAEIAEADGDAAAFEKFSARAEELNAAAKSARVFEDLALRYLIDLQPSLGRAIASALSEGPQAYAAAKQKALR